jgi:mannose/cellobiose epimerase-like protein (N-acyl-D-glucosamine 2-epimerase family)
MRHSARVGDPLTRLREWMAEKALPLWASAGWDDPEGQFVEQLDLSGTPLLNVPRRVMVQSRQIFVYATAHRRGWFRGGDILARRAVDVMIDRYLEPDGMPGWAFSTDRGGAVVDGRRDLYAHAFVLLALAMAQQLSGDRRYADLGRRTLHFLDAKMAHPAGGYVEILPLSDGPRRQNPHMHLLESLLAWHNIAPGGDFLTRAQAIVLLLERHFVQIGVRDSRMVLTEYFDDDLVPLGGPDHVFEPGHHFEWVWLLGEYSRLSGEPLHPIARELWDSGVLLGFGERGLIFDEVTASGDVASASTRLWPYAEYIKAFNLGLPLPAHTPWCHRDEIIERLLLSFLYPALPGAWFDHLDEAGRLKRDNVPASSLYHLCCAIDQSEAALASQA